MKPATKTDPSQTTLGAQATEDPDLLAANGRAAVREVEIEIARILAQGLDNLMNDWREGTLASSRSAWSSPAPGCYKQEQQGTIGEVKSTAAKQEATIAKQEAMIAQQEKQIESLTAGLQKVSDKLELAKPRAATRR
jgi:uncharacterized coiled-coil protein SlyX